MPIRQQQALAPSDEPLTVFNRIISMFRTTCDFWRPSETDRLRNFEMVVGRQWTKEDYDYLIENRRSADVYNWILPVILALSGTQKINRKDLRAYPVSGGDDQRADMITQAMRWSFQKCDKHFQTSRSFLDAVIGRVGWMKSYWSTEYDPEGMMYTDWHDPFRIRFDPETQGDFHRTCNYLIDTPWLTGEALINLYASDDEDLAERMQSQIETIEGRGGERKKAWSWRDKLDLNINLLREAFGAGKTLSEVIHGEYVDVRNGLYRVIELHERRSVLRRYFFDTATGNTAMIPEAVKNNREIINMVRERNPALTVLSRYESLLYVTTVIPAFVADPVAAVPQDAPYDIQNGLYMYTPITCFDFHPDISESRSLVDNLVDPQLSYNKLESTLKDYIVRFVGHGWIYEKGAIEEDDKQDWESREIGVNRAYAQGRRAPKADIPEQLPREVIIGRSDQRDAIRTISGVPLNYQGETQTKNEPASLFSQRVQQGGLMQTTFFDALLRSDRALGKNAIDGLQHYMTEERWLRVLQDEGNPLWLLVNQRTVNGIVNDLSIGKYDIEVDETNYSITARQEAFLQGLSLAKMMPPDLVPWHLLAKNSDMIEKEEWVQYIQQRMGVADRNTLMEMLIAQGGKRAIAGGDLRGTRSQPLPYVA